MVDKPEIRIIEELTRLRANDRACFERLHQALSDEYHRRIDLFMGGTPQELPKFQGAALAFKQLLGYFNQIVEASRS